MRFVVPGFFKNQLTPIDPFVAETDDFRRASIMLAKEGHRKGWGHLFLKERQKAFPVVAQDPVDPILRAELLLLFLEIFLQDGRQLFIIPDDNEVLALGQSGQDRRDGALACLVDDEVVELEGMLSRGRQGIGGRKDDGVSFDEGFEVRFEIVRVEILVGQILKSRIQRLVEKGFA